MRNVCIVVQGYYPKDVRVRKEAMALIRRGYRVSVIALRDLSEKRFEIVDDVNVCRISLKKRRGGILRYIYEYIFFLIIAIVKINILDIKERFDAVHVNTLPDFLVFCAIVQKLKGKRIVLDMHEIAPEFFMSKYGVKRSNPVIQILLMVEKASLRFADGIITVNEPIRRIFQQRAVPKKPIEVVMNTVDLAVMPTFKNRAHAGFNCVYHGTLTQVYCLDVAITGFALVCQNFPDMQFHIFGSGTDSEKLKALSGDLHVSDRVIFHGEMKHSHMIEALSVMDLGVLSSRKDVFLDLTFSNKLSEYIYLHIPVVSSDLETTKYYFSNDQILFFEAGNPNDLAQKIGFAYNNPQHMSKMSDAAYERAKEFRWDIMADKYIATIEGKHAQ